MKQQRQRSTTFRFKQFTMSNTLSAMKIGTDGVLLGAWCPLPSADRFTAVDAGAGTGLIAIMIAQRASGASITAVEYDGNAAAECRLNVEASPWADRITTVHDDFLTYSANAAPVDLVVSNPPYFDSALRSPDASRAMARHGEGFSYASLINACRGKLLTQGGTLAIISPADRERDIRMETAIAGMSVINLCRVITRAGAGPSRLLWHIVKHPGLAGIESQLTVGSSEYNGLTSPFYL